MAALGDLFLRQRGLVEAELAHQRALLGARHLHAQRLGLGLGVVVLRRIAGDIDLAFGIDLGIGIEVDIVVVAGLATGIGRTGGRLRCGRRLGRRPAGFAGSALAAVRVRPAAGAAAAALPCTGDGSGVGRAGLAGFGFVSVAGVAASAGAVFLAVMLVLEKWPAAAARDRPAGRRAAVGRPVD